MPGRDACSQRKLILSFWPDSSLARDLTQEDNETPTGPAKA